MPVDATFTGAEPLIEPNIAEAMAHCQDRPLATCQDQGKIIEELTGTRQAGFTEDYKNRTISTTAPNATPKPR